MPDLVIPATSTNKGAPNAKIDRLKLSVDTGGDVAKTSSPRKHKSTPKASAKSRPRKTGTPASPKTGVPLPCLPLRVTEGSNGALSRLNKLFGEHVNPGGVLRSEAEWECLRRLGQKHLGVGRWMPKANVSSGTEAGMTWCTRVHYIGTCKVDLGDFSGAKLEMRFPGTSVTGKIRLRDLLVLPVRAEYGNLCWYDTSNMAEASLQESPLKAVSIRNDGEDGVSAFYQAGDYSYVIDEPDASNTLTIADPVHMRMGHVLEVVAVPSSSIEALYPRAAGRERTPALLRDLMRRAEALIGGDKRVPDELKGRAIMALAALAMTHNIKQELALVARFKLGCLELNSALRDAFTVPTGIYGWLVSSCHTCRRWSRQLLGGVSTRARVALLGSSALAAWVLHHWLRRNYSVLRKSFVRALLKWVSLLLTWASSLWRVMKRLAGRKSPRRLVPGRIRAIGTSAVITDVVLEETIKRLVPGGTTAIVMVEALRHRSLLYAPTALMHVLAARQNFALGVLLHFFWNKSVLAARSPVETGPDDVCVDAIELRDNEPVADGCSFSIAGQSVNSRLVCCDARPSWHFRALSVDGVVVSVFRSCACNERAAIRSRVTCQESSESSFWPIWWPKASKMPLVVEEDTEVWMHHLPNRARGLINAAPTVAAVEASDRPMQAFVKRELAVESVQGQPLKLDPVPRIIQGRSLPIKVATGPWTWRFGKALRTTYPASGSFVYGGGCSSEELGEVIDRVTCQLTDDGGAWVAFDCKRFDRTVGPTPMRMLYREYVQCGAPTDCLAALAGRDGVRRGSTRNGIRYSRHAQVSSGDGDTTAGNSRIHLVLLEACPSVQAAIVMGDDAVVWTSDASEVATAYRQGGFEPKVSADLDFCSSLFWPSDQGTTLGPKIGRLIGKTFHSMNKIEGSYLRWLRGVCLGLDLSCSHVPILRVLIPHMLSLCGDGPVLRSDDFEYKTRSTERRCTTESTWDYMFERYSLSESDVLDMEAEILRVDIGSVLVGQHWVDLVQRDV